MRKYFFFILLIFLYAASSYAATIDAVKVEGNRRIPTSTILKYAVSAGDEFDMAEIDESIKNLFSSEIVTDVKVDMKVDDEHLVLVYIVKEKPYVDKVLFNGNVEVKTHMLEEEISDMTDKLLDTKQVESNLKLIQDKYQDENFYDVDIKVEIEDKGNNAVDVVYLITEGKEAKVKTINIIGNENYTKDDILDEIETSEKGFWSWLTQSGRLKESELEMDMEKIKALYLRNGYAKVQIAEPAIKVSEDKKWLYLTIVIDEGKRYKVGDVEFKGYEHVELEKLNKVIAMTTGEWFNVEEFQNDIKRVTAQFTNIGYAYANVSPLTNINEAAQTVSINYTVDENQLVYIRRINIRGNDKSRDRVVRRELDITEGELYSSGLIDASKAHLEYTGYYSEVTMAETPISSSLVDLDVEVADQMTGMFSVGVGYSSIDKTTGTVSLTQKNLFGMGYESTIKSEFSEKRTDYSISFTNPWLFDRPYSLSVDIFKTYRDYYEYEKESQGASIGLGHQLIKRKLYASYKLRHETVDISDIDDEASDIIKAQEGETVTVSFTPSLKWITLNHPTAPTRGNKAVFFVKAAGGPLSGDNDFVKYGATYSHYFPISRKLTFMANFEIGQVDSYNGKDIPIAERYRLGGMYSVRGYDYGDISPVDDDDYAYGGSKYDQANFELIFPISESAKLMGVLFYDIGQSYADDEKFFDSKTYRSYGAGFRWYSPIGPLRLELGFPLDDPDGSKTGKWDFSIGGMI